MLSSLHYLLFSAGLAIVTTRLLCLTLLTLHTRISRIRFLVSEFLLFTTSAISKALLGVSDQSVRVTASSDRAVRCGVRCGEVVPVVGDLTHHEAAGIDQ